MINGISIILQLVGISVYSTMNRVLGKKAKLLGRLLSGLKKPDTGFQVVVFFVADAVA